MSTHTLRPGGFSFFFGFPLSLSLPLGWPSFREASLLGFPCILQPLFFFFSALHLIDLGSFSKLDFFSLAFFLFALRT